MLGSGWNQSDLELTKETIILNWSTPWL